ncbi:MAG TPA: DUF2017 family protein [Verrucomicrobiae bacterium]|jgi:hypothetical protein
MKLVKRHRQTLVFELGARERELVIHALRLYPQLNPDYHRITKAKRGRKLEEAQKLLVEAMTERCAENRQLVATFIREKLGGAPVETEKRARGKILLMLTRAQADWMLEVLNDVRVGSWVKLGRPDQTDVRSMRLSAENVAAFGVMEFCGYLQMILLEALQG